MEKICISTYYGVIFALNKLTHPGEKRMVQYAKEQAEILPVAFEENLYKLFQNIYADSEKAMHVIGEMTAELEKIIK